MTIKSIRLTSKRQATLPLQLCEELGIKPGDEIILERQKTAGEIKWLLKPKKKVQSRWFAQLKKYAKNKEHDMATIRSSIGGRIGDTQK
jgi:bifunctional DNA-binding transcriptional regulator/antitoxin component of YhaV-PrlF toxin-antitoxin module